MQVVHSNRFVACTSRRGMYGLMALALAGLALAGNAQATPRSTARHASLCTVAKSVGKDIVQSASVTNAETMTPAKLKAIYTAIVNAEPSLLGAASGPIKVHLQKTLAFVNMIDADFKQVGWNAALLAPKLPSLLPAAKAVAPHIKAVENYLDNTCHLDV